MPCYRCGVRQTDPSRGQSPWKRGVRQYSQILICPGCQDAADWVAEMDRCSQCSSVHLVKRLGEVECRDCGAIVPPSGETGYRGVLEPAGSATGLRGLGDAGLEDPGLAGAGPAGPGLAGAGLVGGDLAGAGVAGGDLAGAGRSPDLSEEVARALDRVLSRSLVSQSLQRAPEPEVKAGSVAGPGAGGRGSGAGGSGSGTGRSGSGTGRSGSGAGRSGSGTGRRRSARAAAGDHTAAHPGAERHRAPRPGVAGLVGEDAGRLDEVRPGAFAG